jgi:diguanylate cyclase (GGDEF)-like protein/PAS domain S-box-containing protein
MDTDRFPQLRIALINLAAAAAYFGLGKMGLWLTSPPDYIALAWPPSGFAVAACVVWGGRKIWPGILLGAFLAEASVQPIGVALTIAIGSTLQALIGAYSLRRMDASMMLSDIRAIRRFVAVTALFCMVAPIFGNTALFADGTLDVAKLPRAAITWWLGDALGVLIFLPLTLTLFDRRPLWNRRRVQLAMPMLTGLLLCGLVFQVARSDDEIRLTAEFSEQADSLVSKLNQVDESNSKGTTVMANLFAMEAHPTPQWFSRSAAGLRREYPLLQSLNWIPFIRPQGIASFEGAMSSKLGRKLVVTPVPGHHLSDIGWIGPVAMIEPLSGNEAALGRDMLSESVRATAILKALKEKMVTASGKITLVQDQQGPGGILINAPVAAASGEVVGVVIGVANLRDLLKPLQLSNDISWSMRDLSSGVVVSETLINPPIFTKGSYFDEKGIYVQRPLTIADRHLGIVLHKPYSAFSNSLFPRSLLVLLLALVSCAGLGLFSLMASASVESTAKEVAEKTQLLRTEIQRRDQSETALRQSETKFRTLYDSTKDAVLLLGDTGFIDCNQAALDLFGCPSKEEFLIHMPGGRLSPPNQPDGTESATLANDYIAAAFRSGSVRFEWVHQRLDNGETFPTEILLTRMEVEGKRIIQGVVRDISERKENESQIRNLAYFDSLTGLPNRRLMMDRLGQALIASNRSLEFGALMILDLDQFKTLNDTQGHDAGDRLLIDVAQKIASSLRVIDTVSRMGGDEFLIMVEGLGSNETSAASQAEAIAEKIRTAINQRYAPYSGAQEHLSSASIGVTLFQGNHLGLEALLKQADMALYQSKGAGRNTIRFFNPAMQAAIESRAKMDTALRDGLRNDEFQLFYQPQMGYGGLLTGAEALLRWLPKNQPPIDPGKFIPLAEDTGFIIPLGIWVIHTACAQLKSWSQNLSTCDLMVSINISARQFREPDFVEKLFDALKLSGANPKLLRLELTESVVLEDVEIVIERMQQIKALGVTFSLDDFGTGFSSLSYLKRLPLNEVKIDRTFVRDIATDPSDEAIVRAIISMSESLGIEVIAEGVETQTQLDFLKSNGCTRYQGYLFGKPMAIQDWGDFLPRT